MDWGVGRFWDRGIGVLGLGQGVIGGFGDYRLGDIIKKKIVDREIVGWGDWKMGSEGVRGI